MSNPACAPEGARTHVCAIMAARADNCDGFRKVDRSGLVTVTAPGSQAPCMAQMSMLPLDGPCRDRREMDRLHPGRHPPGRGEARGVSAHHRATGSSAQRLSAPVGSRIAVQFRQGGGSANRRRRISSSGPGYERRASTPVRGTLIAGEPWRSSPVCSRAGRRSSSCRARPAAHCGPFRRRSCRGRPERANGVHGFEAGCGPAGGALRGPKVALRSRMVPKPAFG